MHIKKFIILVLILWCSNSPAEEAKKLVLSYTMEEMYQMAMFFKNMRTGIDLEDMSQHMKAAEFKGYVAAILDNETGQDKQLTECVRKHPTNDIAMRTALVITSNSLDRSRMPSLAVYLGIRFACDESMWKESD